MSLEIPRLFWPLTLTASNNGIKFTVSGGAHGGAIYTGTVAAATYYDPETLYAAVEAGFEAATDGTHAYKADHGGEVTVAMTADGVLSITFVEAGCTQVVIHWNDGGAAVVALAALLGFSSAANDTDASDPFTFTADYQMQHFWTPGICVETDSEDRKIWTRAVAEAAGGQASVIQHGSYIKRRKLRFDFLSPVKVFTSYAGGGNTNGDFETFYTDATALGRFRYWPDRATTGTYSDLFVLDASSRDVLEKSARKAPGVQLYSIELECGGYNA